VSYYKLVINYLYSIPVIVSFFDAFAGIIYNNMLSRCLEADVLFGMSFQPAVALTGLRQVGKTTLAKKLLINSPQTSAGRLRT
jgi:hypothetical protein